MKQINRNIKMLEIIGSKLEELSDELVFVGGSIIQFLITDEASPDVRFTMDVDCIINVITLVDYHKLEKKLRRKGFRQNFLEESFPICRWEYKGILLDVVPVDKKILGFSNRWYRDAIKNAMTQEIKKGLEIQVITAPYFLATKLEAFKDRGENSFISSHDIEDILAVIDGRPEIVMEVNNASPKLKKYLSSEFARLFADKNFIYALAGNLNYSGEYLTREKIVIERIKEIIDASVKKKK